VGPDARQDKATSPFRRRTRAVRVGPVTIGGDAPVSVQSMTNTATTDVDATVAQIARLAAGGCDIARLAIATRDDARALEAIKPQAALPLVADVHYDPDLAVAAVEAGADKVRVNPGNMKDRAKLDRLAAVLRERGVPVRVGVNSGSVRARAAGARIDSSTPMVDAMTDALFEGVRFFQTRGVDAIVLSAKASDVRDTIETYRRIARLTELPLHLGVTAAGPPDVGVVRNAIGIGALLAEGIGDTIRVSLTGAPEEEVRVGREILRSLGLAPGGIRVISCPTCSRCEVDLAAWVERVRAGLPETGPSLTVAVMGCVVNGPGEAREADVGIVAGRSDAFLFTPGNAPARVPCDEAVARLVAAVRAILAKRASAP